MFADCGINRADIFLFLGELHMFEFVKENEKPLDVICENGGYTAIFRTIGCIGDSLSSGEFESDAGEGKSGYHDMFEYSWGQYIARMCGSKVYNFSRGGMKADWYCNEYAEDNGFWNPDLSAQAYIIALGVNDILNAGQEIGSVDDICDDDWDKNAKTFAGYYGKIIQRMKAIQPRAKFFFVTMPRGVDNETIAAKKEAHAKLLNDFAAKFDNSYVIDLYKYAPVYSHEFRRCMYMRGHMNPMGYIYTARIISSYIDFIIRSNPQDFKEVPFIGTDLHS